MVVLEDDVLLDERFDFGALPTLMSQLDIHYLKLYSRFLTRFRYLGRIGQRGLYRFVVPPYGSQAYVISKVGARRLVSAAKRIERPIDDEMDRYWVNGLPTYVLFPFPVLESELGSTIAKGSAQLTLLQGIESRAFIWADKVPREYANLRLLLRDRITRDKVLGLAGLA
jgi:GR25 family glycosyltransferase involved in LPS biosynthesis